MRTTKTVKLLLRLHHKLMLCWFVGCVWLMHPSHKLWTFAGGVNKTLQLLLQSTRWNHNLSKRARTWLVPSNWTWLRAQAAGQCKCFNISHVQFPLYGEMYMMACLANTIICTALQAIWTARKRSRQRRSVSGCAILRDGHDGALRRSVPLAVYKVVRRRVEYAQCLHDICIIVERYIYFASHFQSLNTHYSLTFVTLILPRRSNRRRTTLYSHACCCFLHAMLLSLCCKSFVLYAYYLLCENFRITVLSLCAHASPLHSLTACSRCSCVPGTFDDRHCTRAPNCTQTTADGVSQPTDPLRSRSFRLLSGAVILSGPTANGAMRCGTDRMRGVASNSVHRAKCARIGDGYAKMKCLNVKFLRLRMLGLMSMRPTDIRTEWTTTKFTQCRHL